MHDRDSDPDRDRFYADLIGLLREVKPAADWSDPAPDAHLWAEGYLDSVGLLEVIYFIEERLGTEIELTGDFLPNFFTMRSIYDGYIAPARTATSSG